MKEHISPEEKLLEIIRKGNSDPAKKTQSAEKFSSSPWASFKKSLQSFRLKHWLPGTVIVFFILSLALLLFSLIFAFLPAQELSRKPGQEIKLALSAEEAPVATLESYLAAVSKKDIFNSAAFKKESNATASSDGLKNLALLGIIKEEPKQAILKNKTTQDIYYLKEGESLGEFKVAQILDGKIVVEYRDEQYEIYL